MPLKRGAPQKGKKQPRPGPQRKTKTFGRPTLERAETPEATSREEEAGLVAKEKTEGGVGMSIEVAGAAVSDFMRKVLKKEGQVIKAERTEEGWEVGVEVIEENEFIKSLGIPKTVYDRNVYLIRLDDKLEVTSYTRLKESSPVVET